LPLLKFQPSHTDRIVFKKKYILLQKSTRRLASFSAVHCSR